MDLYYHKTHSAAKLDTKGDIERLRLSQRLTLGVLGLTPRGCFGAILSRSIEFSLVW